MKTTGIRVLALLGTSMAVLGLADPAWAQVAAAGSTDATGVTSVAFTFTHGCDDAPTTFLRIGLPPEASRVRPVDLAGWTSQIDGGELVWSGGEVDSAANGTFVAEMRISGAKGDTVYFPTVQGCPSTQLSWTEKTADPAADHAAPRLVLGETVAPAEPDAGPQSTAIAGSAPGNATAVPPAGGTMGSDVVADEHPKKALVVGLAVVLTAACGTALKRRRSR